MDPARAASLNVIAQAAIDHAMPVDPIEGVDGGLTVPPARRTDPRGPAQAPPPPAAAGAAEWAGLGRRAEF